MKTRFAPSPTGLLHLGNIYAALECELWAKTYDAQLLLRIEDIDFTRCKPEFTKQMIDDLRWIGISFDGQVTYQSQRSALYQEALDKLKGMGVLYPCFCTRKQVTSNTINPNPQQLDTYPKTCRYLSPHEKNERQHQVFSWRLDSQQAQRMLGEHLYWWDEKQCKHYFSVVGDIGDVIIGRKDIHYSYHLAVVVDDAQQDITHVVRGEDLKTSTPVHRVLQLLLAYESPRYIHHSLLLDAQGTRLAKSKGSTTLLSLREQGLTANNVRDIIKKVSKS